jgi:hypothetical protein
MAVSSSRCATPSTSVSWALSLAAADRVDAGAAATAVEAAAAAEAVGAAVALEDVVIGVALQHVWAAAAEEPI